MMGLVARNHGTRHSGSLAESGSPGAAYDAQLQAEDGARRTRESEQSVAQVILVEIVVTLKLATGPVGTYYRQLLRANGFGHHTATTTFDRTWT